MAAPIRALYPSVSALITSTRPTMTAGTIIEAGGYAYTAADSGASDHHLTVPGGVKLYVNPDQDGYRAIEAWGVTGDGSAPDRVLMQAAVAATPYLRWQSKEYLIGAFVNVPTGYATAHRKTCLLAAATDIMWRTAGQTTLKINDALQAGADQDDIAILFQYDANRFSAPGFIFDENAAAQGYGAPLALYGVLDIDLDRVTVRNNSPLRMGASVARLCGSVRGFVRCENGQGSFAAGSKPGGTNQFVNFGAEIIDSRGGINIEAENVEARVGLTHEVETAVIGQIVGRHIHDAVNAVEFVKIENGAKRVSVAQIDLEDASSSVTGRATALSIKAGQGTPGPIESVQVGTINTKDTSQAIWFESESTLPIGDLRVDAIHVLRTQTIIDCRNGYGATGAGLIRSVDIGSVQGVVADPLNAAVGSAFAVSSDPSNVANNGRDPHLDRFSLSGGHLASVGMRTFTMRGVKNVSVRNLTVDAHISASPSGGYAGTNYNVIEADHIVLDTVTLRGFAGSGTPLVLRPKLSCRVVGLDITGNGAGTALFFGGSGDVLISGCMFRGATNAINFTASTGTFDAATAVDATTDRLTITAHVFRHGEKVRYTAGSTPIGGLTTATDYYVLYIDANTIQLSATIRGAAIDLTSVGAGTATLKRSLTVLAANNRNECSVFNLNDTNALSYTASGTW